LGENTEVHRNFSQEKHVRTHLQSRANIFKLPKTRHSRPEDSSSKPKRQKIHRWLCFSSNPPHGMVQALYVHSSRQPQKPHYCRVPPKPLQPVQQGQRGKGKGKKGKARELFVGKGKGGKGGKGKQG
jgi:hypothetical protein